MTSVAGLFLARLFAPCYDVSKSYFALNILPGDSMLSSMGPCPRCSLPIHISGIKFYITEISMHISSYSTAYTHQAVLSHIYSCKVFGGLPHICAAYHKKVCIVPEPRSTFYIACVLSIIKNYIMNYHPLFRSNWKLWFKILPILMMLDRWRSCESWQFSTHSSIK